MGGYLSMLNDILDDKGGACLNSLYTLSDTMQNYLRQHAQNSSEHVIIISDS